MVGNGTYYKDATFGNKNAVSVAVFRFSSLLVATLCPIALLNAQSPTKVPHSPRTLPGIRAKVAPKIDGVLSPSEWPEECHSEGFTDADTGTISDEKAEFWITYDDHHVYFAARAFTNPNKLVDEEYRQNVNLRGNDVFTLAVDACSSGQDADIFQINPRGATGLRLAGGRAAKTEWLGDFEASGAKTPNGWLVEAAIPWTLIKRPKSGKHDMTFNVLWFRSNKSNTYEWEYTKQAFANFPKLLDVEVPEVINQQSLKLLPYGYFGYDKDIKHITNAGVDMKTEIGDNLTLVGTVNPDFRNIENGILSLDFSYFERLADDNRPFFQEGARYRQFGFDSKLFASQRIGDFDAGINAYGEMGPTTFGFLATNDFGNKLSTALSTSTRLDERSTLNFNYAGNFEPGKKNNAARFFYDRRFGDWNYYLGGDFTDDEILKSGNRITAGAFRESGGVIAFLDYTEVSESFFPRLGFAPETGFRAASVSLEREIQPYGKVVRDYTIKASGLYANRLNGDPYRRNFSFGTGVTFTNLVGVEVNTNNENFEGSNDNLYEFNVSYPIGSPYRNVGVSYGSGRFGGEKYRNIGFRARYRPMPRTQLDFRTQFVDYKGSTRQTIMSLNYDLGKYEAIGGRLVRQDDKWNWYLSYRISGKVGNEFFLILGDPNSREFRHSLILKAVIPCSIKF